MGSSASKYFEIPKFFVFGEKGIFTGSTTVKAGKVGVRG